MVKDLTKKIIVAILLAFFILPVFYFSALADAPASERLAKSPAECGSQPADPNNAADYVPPRNCVFIEEPIGGKVGYDLYTVSCFIINSKDACQYLLWGGGQVLSNERGPIQAILSYEEGKEYQGPFGLLYNYLGLIYSYMSGLIVGIAVLYVVVGGIQMTTSAGDTEAFGKGKARIVKSIVGIILWFTASLILYTINPTFFAF
ncbi:pilin [candidate division KSB1 bacterium]